jgi:alpha-1,2-mannosyltransferase
MTRTPKYRIDRTLAVAYFLWLGVAAGFLVSYFSNGNGLLDATGNLIGRDFANMWTGARAVTTDAVERLFDYESYRVFQTELFGVVLPPHNWSYPPHILVFIAPLAIFSYPAALAIWSIAGLALYLAACTRSKRDPFELALLALAPASLVNLLGGQNGFFTAAMIWTGLKLLDRKPVVAGIAFGLLSLKPQLGLLLPFVLVLDRRWLVIASTIATAAVLMAATALLFGPEIFLAYATKALPYQSKLFTEMDGIFVRMMPTAFMNARLAGADASVAWLIQAPVSVIAVAFVLWAWWKTEEPMLRGAAFVTATFLASPYLFVYDMTAFGPVLVALWSRAEGPGGKTVLGILWSLPVTCVLLGLVSAPISAFLLGLFALWLAGEIIQHRSRGN